MNVRSWGDGYDDDDDGTEKERWCNHDSTMGFRCKDKNMKHWGDDR